MEEKSLPQNAGKAPETAVFEPNEASQSWENSHYIMGLHPMATTGTECRPEAGSVVTDTIIDDWQSGKAAAPEIQQLLSQIATDMRQNVNRRRSLRISKREAARNACVSPPDPEGWRRDFAALKAKGLEDINIGYWRVSTIQQSAEEGPERQQRAIVAHAIAHTERGVDLWVCDVDSGTEESRVGLDFLMEAIESGFVQSITVERLDRLARNQYLAEAVNRAAFARRVQIRSATEHIPQGAVGDLLRQILQAIAQYELAVIKSRLSGGKKVKREREGTANGGETAYGYLSAGEGYLVLCEPEARIVRLIFLLYESGYTQSAIAEALNRWHFPTRNGGKLGWRQSQISRIIRNEAAYRSERLFTQTIERPAKVAHPPILENRPDPADRTYLYGNVVSRPRTRVPDDFALEMPDILPIPSSFHSLTPEQAMSLRTMYELRDRGFSIARICEELGRLGLKSITGRPWKYSNAQACLRRRELYSAAIERAGITECDVNALLDPAAHEAAAVERIHRLRSEGMSIPQIRAALTEAGIRTANGAEWSISSIHRVLEGRARQAIGRSS